MLLTLPEIKAKVDQLAEKIGAPQEILRTYGYSKGDGHPDIDIDLQGYCYLIVERDIVCDRLRTKDIDELLYKLSQMLRLISPPSMSWQIGFMVKIIEG